jgi:hypothetical protein
MEVVLARNRSKEKRFGPGPANNYTSGYGKRWGMFSFLRRKKTARNESALPEHTHPDQLASPVRDSYATETTAVGHELPTYPKYSESGHGYGPTTGGVQHGTTTGTTGGYTNTGKTGGGYRYGDGVYDHA